MSRGREYHAVRRGARAEDRMGPARRSQAEQGAASIDERQAKPVPS